MSLNSGAVSFIWNLAEELAERHGVDGVKAQLQAYGLYSAGVAELWDSVAEDPDLAVAAAVVGFVVGVSFAPEIAASVAAFELTGVAADLAAAVAGALIDAGSADAFKTAMGFGDWAASALGGAFSSFAQWVKNAFGAAEQPVSPLVLDLNGDGIQLSSFSDSTAFFDLTGNDFARHTGWVTGGDGFLAIDSNGNGKIDNISELFGNSTTDGFSVLSALDSNGDGIIDANDTSFSQLRIWIDSNGDGITDLGELITLAQEGISSINLDAVSSNEVISGNSISSESTFTWMDGTAGSIVDAWFQNDATDSRYVGAYQFNAQAMLLPYVRGYGTVPDLWIAMSQNETLLDMTSQLVANIDQDPAITLSDVKSLLLEWSGSSAVNPTSRGDYFDAQELDFLEKFTGEAFYDPNYDNVPGLPPTNPRWLSAVSLREGWNSAYDGVLARLILQAGYDLPEFTYDPQADKVLPQTDLATSLADEFQKLGDLNASNEAQWEIVLRVADASRLDLNLASEAFVSTIATSASASLAAIADAMVSGESFTVNADGSIALSGVTTDSILHAGGNVRSITLTGTASNLPPSMNDTIVYQRGDGNLNLNIVDYSSAPTNTIQLGAGLTATNVTMNVSGNDLLIGDDVSGDLIRVVDQFKTVDGVTLYPVETLVYGDGTSLNLTGGLPIAGGAGNDILYGTIYGDTLSGGSGDDTLSGNGGNDTFMGNDGADVLNGSYGNDTLTGGTGNDTLNGHGGNDTYVFNSGDGSDTINEDNGIDTIQLGAGLTLANVIFRVSGNDLLISDGVSGDLIKLANQYNLVYGTSYQVETLVYGDGSSISLTGGLPIVGTGGDDTLNGTNYDDTFTGAAGDDVLNGRSGNDTLIGGTGNDTLNGADGNDTYIFNAGDGSDTITENNGSDTLQLGNGLTAANTTFNVSGNDLLISDGVSGDLIKVSNQYNLVYGTSYQVETLVYGDGTSISLTGGLPIVGGSGNDTLNGTSYNDALQGNDGADVLNAGSGNDTLAGGTGNDTLNGADGNDTYVFNAGDGSDTINENHGTDTIQLGAGLTASNVTFNLSGNDLLISDGTSGDLIRVANQYNLTYGTSYQVETLIYGDGTTISLTGGLPIVGTSGDDTLNGTSGNSSLFGLAGNDVLNGSYGNDTLTGGTGNDTLNGASGNDTYIFNAGDGSDTINENNGNDTLQLGAGLTAANVIFRVSGNDLLISDGVSGDQIKVASQYNLTYGTSYQVETLVYGDGTSISLTGGLPIVGSSGDDTLAGTNYDDTLTGGAGNDTLNAGYGNDTLTGGIGDDTLNGGSGNDTYIFNAGDGTDTINENNGTDTIRLGAGLTAANVTFNVSGSDLLISDGVSGDLIRVANQYNLTYGTSYQVETLVYGDGTSISLTGGLPIVGGSGADTLNGTAYDDSLQGNDGADVLNAGSGNDTLTGGHGNDTLNGADGNDTYIFNAGDGSDTINENNGTDTIRLGTGLTAANVTFNVSGNDLLISDSTSGDLIKLASQYNLTYGTSYQVETLVYGDGTSISLTGGLPIVGGSGADTLNGTAYDDSLQGNDGADVLNAGSGNDTLIGGTGSDTLNGANGNDTYVFNAGDGSDTINENNGTDTIRLGTGLTAANVTFNVSGNDLLISDGTSGDQIKVVNQYYLTYGTSYQVETLVYGDGTSISLTGGLPIVGGTGSDTLNGTAYDDSLQGNDGADVLNAGSGNDTLIGGTGSDTLNGANGNDTYVFNAGDGSDTINENNGTDTIQLGAGLTAANVTFNVSGNDLLISDGTSGDQIKVVNQYYLTYGTSYQVETLVYGDGTSISLTGGLPIVGGSGSDTLNGTAYDDSLQGNDGADVLNAGSGNDTLTGGRGNDTLNGADGNDIYIFNAGDGSDTINENHGTDTIQLGAGLTTANVTLSLSGYDLLISDGVSGDQIKVVNQYNTFYGTNRLIETLVYGDGTSISLAGGLPIVGSTGDDTLNGTSGNNSIYGFAGNDTLNGNGGNDTFIGGAGDDTLNGGSGVDIFVYQPNFGHDTINGFAASGTNADLVSMDHTVFADWAHLLAASTQSGSDVLITADASDSILLKNVSLSSLQQSQFQFV